MLPPETRMPLALCCGDLRLSAGAHAGVDGAVVGSDHGLHWVTVVLLLLAASAGLVGA